MPRINKNAIQKRFKFLLHFDDGRTEEITVQSETYHGAIYSLPRFADVGRYRYEYIKN